jgi:hypothetical protein
MTEKEKILEKISSILELGFDGTYDSLGPDTDIFWDEVGAVKVKIYDLVKHYHRVKSKKVAK